MSRSIRSVIEEVIAYLSAFLSSERERRLLCIKPTQMMLEKMHIRWLAGRGNAYHWSKTKVFTRGLSFVLMDSFLCRRRISHPLLKPKLEDPKMELKIFLLPLHLGLLAAFHQNAEVNILTTRFPTIYYFSRFDFPVFQGVSWLIIFRNLNMPLKQGQGNIHTLDKWATQTFFVLEVVSTAVGWLHNNPSGR